MQFLKSFDYNNKRFWNFIFAFLHNSIFIVHNGLLLLSDGYRMLSRWIVIIWCLMFDLILMDWKFE
jgi:hypothetical protein